MAVNGLLMNVQYINVIYMMRICSNNNTQCYWNDELLTGDFEGVLEM